MPRRNANAHQERRLQPLPEKVWRRPPGGLHESPRPKYEVPQDQLPETRVDNGPNVEARLDGVTDLLPGDLPAGTAPALAP